MGAVNYKYFFNLVTDEGTEECILQFRQGKITTLFVPFWEDEVEIIEIIFRNLKELENQIKVQLLAENNLEKKKDVIRDIYSNLNLLIKAFHKREQIFTLDRSHTFGSIEFQMNQKTVFMVQFMKWEFVNIRDEMIFTYKDFFEDFYLRKKEATLFKKLLSAIPRGNWYAMFSENETGLFNRNKTNYCNSIADIEDLLREHLNIFKENYHLLLKDHCRLDASKDSEINFINSFKLKLNRLFVPYKREDNEIIYLDSIEFDIPEYNEVWRTEEVYLCFQNIFMKEMCSFLDEKIKIVHVDLNKNNGKSNLEITHRIKAIVFNYKVQSGIEKKLSRKEKSEIGGKNFELAFDTIEYRQAKNFKQPTRKELEAVLKILKEEDEKANNPAIELVSADLNKSD